MTPMPYYLEVRTVSDREPWKLSKDLRDLRRARAFLARQGTFPRSWIVKIKHLKRDGTTEVVE